ncbi:hypothetical protein [Nonomuraea longicatena]|uniref:Uncharacterized protein n=1 Tax=Nonomuraea longicatena TaxID=83682 RepID=A0ABP3ZD16_9ACTN
MDNDADGEHTVYRRRPSSDHFAGSEEEQGVVMRAELAASGFGVEPPASTRPYRDHPLGSRAAIAEELAARGIKVERVITSDDVPE